MAETKLEPQNNIEIPEVVSVGDFAGKLGVPVTKVIGELMKNGVMATINEQIDFDTAAIIGADLGFEISPAPSDVAAQPEKTLAKGEGESRPPVVAVMGHVDHGKTSLLDAIRSSDVATKEAGGITQHIGAYQVKRGERWITFLDTPGHEAFSALREHGAKMTDVAIIVVAADDGVKPQTKEAIKHAQDAGVQMVIAVNKIDKEGADPNRVRQELSELELVPEEWGGKTVMVDVSAKSKQNIEKLLDMVLLVADIEELRAQKEGPSRGVIIESHLATGRGPVGTVLVQSGTLKLGDYIVAGSTYAKVRTLEDYRGRRIKAAYPGMPAVATGFKDVPSFGDYFEALSSDKEAKELVLKRQRSQSIKSLNIKKIDAGDLNRAISAGQVQELNLIVKADVQGSLESLLSSLEELHNDEVGVKIVGSGIGDVSESDVSLAKATGAILIGFNVSVGSMVRQLAVREGVSLKLYRVIYELLDEVKASLSQMLAPEVIEHVVGTLEVLGVFKTTKNQVVCGGRVTGGKVEMKRELNIYRGDEVVGHGSVESLEKEKQETKEVFEGDLCGMKVATTAKIEVGDRLEFITKETKARSL